MKFKKIKNKLSNLSVLVHKGLLMQDWVLRLGFTPSFGGIFFLPLLILDLTLKNSPNFMNFKLCPQQYFRASGAPVR